MIVPTWLYHIEKEAQIFNDREEAMLALKSGWAHSPAVFEKGCSDEKELVKEAQPSKDQESDSQIGQQEADKSKADKKPRVSKKVTKG